MAEPNVLLETEEQLLGVAGGTIVRSADGSVACRHWDLEHGVVFGDDRPFLWTARALHLPVEVLWPLPARAMDRAADPSAPQADAAPMVMQTILAGDSKRKGNCVAACVATLLGIPLEEVPHFVEFGIAYGDSADVHAVSSGHNWWSMLLGFMAAKGYWPVELESVSHGEVGETLFVAGKSPRGLMHQVLYRESRLWHDPHPSGAGLVTIDEVIAWRPFSGFDHTPTAGEHDADA